MVERVDFRLKRIYLHSNTVTQGFNAVDAHFEISQIIANNLNNEQHYIHPSIYEGNFNKGDGTFTPRYVVYRSGWRLVPYGLVGHELRVLVEMLSFDGIKDRQLFDRSTVAPSVFIDVTPTYERVEIRQVATGSALSDEQAIMLMELWKRQGLDANTVLRITDTLIQIGSIHLAINRTDDATELVRVNE